MTIEEIEKFATPFYELRWWAFRDRASNSVVRLNGMVAAFDSREKAEQMLPRTPGGAAESEIVEIRVEWPDKGRFTVFAAGDEDE